MIETLIAELSKQEGKYQNGYNCTVYRVDRFGIPRWPELPEDKFLVLEEDGIYNYSRDGIRTKIEPTWNMQEKDKQRICGLVLSATQASRSKAAKIINRHLASQGDERRIDSKDVFLVKP